VTYDQKHVLVFMYSTRYAGQNSMKLEHSRQTFEKYSSIIFHEDPCIGDRFVPCGRTDGHDEAIAFCNFANAPKIVFSASAHTLQRAVVSTLLPLKPGHF
jgi:hypothetical protein